MAKSSGNQLWNLMAFFYEYIFQRFPPYQTLLRHILNNFDKNSNSSDTFLDAGCGTGIVSMELARQGYFVVGVDRSTAMLRKAQKKKQNENLPNIRFVNGDLNRLKLDGYSFNKVLFIHSFYLLDEPQLALNILSSGLAPGSEVLMCNPCRRLTLRELCRGWMSFLREGIRTKSPISILISFTIAPVMGGLNIIIQKRKKRTYHCWTKEEITKLLRECGFKIKWFKESCLAESHLLLSAIKEP